MKHPLSQNGTLLDFESGRIILSFERISIEFAIEEFLEFCELVDETRLSVLNDPDFVVGTYDDENGEKKEILLMKPEDEDYN